MRAASYCRFSSNNQREESNDDQFAAITDYAAKKGIVIVESYFDVAKTATSDDRPGFQKMVRDGERGLFDVLLVYKLDRFARDRYDSVFYKRKLKNNGVSVISINESIDGSPESVMMESMLEGMAEYYSRDLSRNAKRGLTSNAHKCKATGGKPAFGYDINEDKYYVINEHEAFAVIKIFDMYAQGQSYTDIVDWLNNSGYKTKNGGEFKKNSLHSLLKNEKYIGVYVFKKSSRSKYKYEEAEEIRIEDGVPAIVSKKTFSIVQHKMKANKQRSQVFKAKELYVLSGKVQCGECGEKMFGNRRKSPTGSVWAGYLCHGRKLKKCSAKEINKHKLETVVLNHLENTIFTDDYIQEMAANIHAQYMNQRSTVTDEIEVLSENLKDVNRKIENVIKAVLDGMSSDVLKQKLTQLEYQKNEIEAMIMQVETTAENELTLDDIIKYLSLGKNITEKSTQEKMNIVDTFVEKIIVHAESIDIYFYMDHFKKRRGYIGAPWGYSFVSTFEFMGNQYERFA